MRSVYTGPGRKTPRSWFATVMRVVMNLKTLSLPVTLGRKKAPNRLVNHPMECNDGDRFGNPTDLTLRRYRQLAAGGAGMIHVESLSVSHDSRGRRNQLEIGERNAESLAKLLSSIREVNDESLIIFQINHSGNISNPDFSKVVSYCPTGDPWVHVLSDEEVEDLKEMFVKAAVIAFQVGADGIDFKQCHGYWCAQLLRPANIRQGRYGGSFENRTRFFRETAGVIRDRIRDDGFLLGARFSFYEGIPGGFGTAGPDEVVEDPSEPLAFARMIQDAGFHFISISGGVPVLTGEITRPTRVYPEGVYRHFGWTKAARAAVGIPVIGSGYSYLRDGKNNLVGNDPLRKSLLYWADRNIRAGRADLVGVGRQSLADPLFVKKALGGRWEDINYCTSCGGCSVLLASQARVGCVVYDDFYRKELKRVRKEKKPDQV